MTLTYNVNEEITLRMFQESDVEELYLLTMSSKQHLQPWLSWFHQMYSIEDALRYIHGTHLTFVEHGGIPATFAIIYRNHIAGTISINNMNYTDKNASIGYWLGEQYVGK